MTSLRRTTPAPPVRLVHLGLGSFFRAHQAWYTHHSPDRDDWGYAAFSGRSSALASALARQDGLYTLVTRDPVRDRFEVVRSVVRTHAATDSKAWLGYLASSDVAVVTLTVTEAGYRRDHTGGLDLADPGVRADLAALHGAGPEGVGTVPGRLVAGLAARRDAGGGSVTLVPCDNLPGNGAVLHRVLIDLAAAVDPGLPEWMGAHVSYLNTVVDRITPAITPADMAAVAAGTGVEDAAPVVTEPFSEWVLAGAFPAGHPDWTDAGAVLAHDVAPYEQRKLLLLNGAHSLLAYAGSVRGAATVAEAVADPLLQQWLDQWWDEAATQLPLPDGDVAAYRAALQARFANPRMQHRLAQIAQDGSEKLPVRVLPVLRAERAAGQVPVGSIRILAAWLCHLRGLGVPVIDPRAAELVLRATGLLPDAARRVLAALAPDLADDDQVTATMAALAEDLAP